MKQIYQKLVVGLGLSILLPWPIRADDAAKECQQLLVLTELHKTELNATLYLHAGDPLPDELVAALKKAGQCSERTTITVGAISELPNCSRHGQLTWSVYLRELKSVIDRDSNVLEDDDYVEKAAYALAKYHGNPKSKEYDFAKALYYAEKSVAKNYAPAQYLLGESYVTGYGVSKDEAKGMRLIGAAAAQGFQPAIAELQRTSGSATNQPAATAQNGISEKQETEAGRAGQPATPAKGTAADRIRSAKTLLDNGLISKEEYEAARKRILDEL